MRLQGLLHCACLHNLACWQMALLHMDQHCFTLQVGPGVKSLSEGDVVLPCATFMGTWTTRAVWKDKQLLKVPGKPAANKHHGPVDVRQAADWVGKHTASPVSNGKQVNLRSMDTKQTKGVHKEPSVIIEEIDDTVHTSATDNAVGGSDRSTADVEVLSSDADLPMPLEYLAINRELCTAYKLLEDHGALKVEQGTGCV